MQKVQNWVLSDGFLTVRRRLWVLGKRTTEVNRTARVLITVDVGLDHWLTGACQVSPLGSFSSRLPTIDVGWMPTSKVRGVTLPHLSWGCVYLAKLFGILEQGKLIIIFLIIF